jgi:4-hydroxy-tetrahydrodipicolinate synthase
MITPYNEDLTIDVGAYRTVIAWYIARKVGGLYANCLSSEMYALNAQERLRLVSEAVQAAAGQVPVAATGNLGDTVEAHIAFCQRVADAGADIVMLVVPPFYESEADLERYYLTLAEQVDATLGLYECPVPRPYHLSVNLVQTLARTGRFYAFKETSCNLAKIKALLEVTQDTPLALLQANTPYLLDFIRDGGVGTMSIATIWLPDLVTAVIEKARTGDPDAARLQGVLCTLELVQRVVHPQGTKILLHKRGLPVSARTRQATHPAQAAAPLAHEIVQALDYAAAQWFDADGDLRALDN